MSCKLEVEGAGGSRKVMVMGSHFEILRGKGIKPGMNVVLLSR